MPWRKDEADLTPPKDKKALIEEFKSFVIPVQSKGHINGQSQTASQSVVQECISKRFIH